MRKILLIIAAAVAVGAGAWQDDILGDGYEMEYIDQGRDYSGPVRSTVVRLQPSDPTGAGVLYVHGFNDYFFQQELGHRIADAGYGFYAVDLRKYGRSLMEGQRPFQLHDISEYYADIDSAIAVMRRDGIDRIALMGHSTGGLTVTCYMATRAPQDVRCVVLNSPFLDWNLSKWNEKFMVPLVRSVAPLMKGLRIPQGADPRYSHSLLRSHGGEWDYDTTWKMVESPAVEASWIAAIDAAHDLAQRYSHIPVPVMVLHSDSTVARGDGPEAYARKDAVLDVADIDRYGRLTGVDVTMVTVPGGLHDLALSAPPVRALFYDTVLAFLRRNLQ